MTKWLSIIGPLLGLVLIAVWVTASARRVPHEKALAAPPTAPYENSIAATGIVEASDRNYNLAPPVSGQLSTLYVKENDIVHRDAECALDSFDVGQWDRAEGDGARR